ncbi:hypothetical protein BJX61DRAFT_547386 [Aspergillus egyptiacus]|nr:hypothetical protein BJX61DRAFT_547386 [Aspergillus egyptiacus]
MKRKAPTNRLASQELPLKPDHRKRHALTHHQRCVQNNQHQLEAVQDTKARKSKKPLDQGRTGSAMEPAAPRVDEAVVYNPKILARMIHIDHPNHRASKQPPSRASYPAKRAQPENLRLNDQPGLKTSQCDKARSPSALFNPAKRVQGPVSRLIHDNNVIVSGPPQKIPEYEGTKHHVPLNSDAIASILTQCKPNCIKAQAMVNARKARKAARERTKKRIKENEGLRKQVLQKRGLQHLLNSNISQGGGRQVLNKHPPKRSGERDGYCGDGQRYPETDGWDGEDTANMEASARAYSQSLRLRALLWNDETPDSIFEKHGYEASTPFASR